MNQIVARRELMDAVQTLVKTNQPNIGHYSEVVKALSNLFEADTGMPVAIEMKVAQGKLADIEASVMLGATLALVRELVNEIEALKLPVSAVPMLYVAKELLNGTLPSFKHTRSGGCYVKLLEGKLEADGTPVTVYAGESGTWVRPTTEFDDGRFQLVA